ncbi:hypothetical protein M0P65_01085 [Candidatus Gracilibacteria bacterium]|nr:hypothetical protein [Candidatus Gracilibacteria bacterium]
MLIGFIAGLVFIKIKSGYNFAGYEYGAIGIGIFGLSGIFGLIFLSSILFESGNIKASTFKENTLKKGQKILFGISLVLLVFSIILYFYK